MVRSVKVHRIPAAAGGPVTLVWGVVDGKPQIVRVHLSAPGRPAAGPGDFLPQESCPEINAVAAAIAALLAGRNVRVSSARLQLSACSPFQRRVFAALQQIPRGEARSYRQIAVSLGLPRHARAVAAALASNPFPLIIPCHRAVRSDRQVGGYQGGSALKQVLLEQEGVRFDQSGRISSL